MDNEISVDGLQWSEASRHDEAQIDSLVDPARTLDEFEDMPPPELPPAIAKDRVMARVREDSVNYYVPPPEE